MGEVIESRDDNPEVWDETLKWLALRNGTYIPLCDPSPVVHMEDVVPSLRKENLNEISLLLDLDNESKNTKQGKKIYEIETNDINSNMEVYMEDISVQRLTIRTNNIDRSISFYSVLGFYPIAKYTVKFQRSVWLRLASYDHENENKQEENNPRNKTKKALSPFVIELIQIPDPPLARSKVLNLVDEKNENIIGINRFCIDVTDIIRNRIDLFPHGLSDWLEAVNKKSQENFGKKIKILEEPFQQMIYRQIIETCYISDDSGVIIEIMNRLRFINDEEMIMDW